MMERVKIVVHHSVWIEVRKNIEGVPVPEVWCIDCIRIGSGGSNNNNLNIK